MPLANSSEVQRADRWWKRLWNAAAAPCRPADRRPVTRLATAGTLVALAWTAYLVVANWSLFIRSRGYIDYCEGLVLFHQTLAASGENVYDVKYRQAPLYSLPMYGPVFYYLLAPIVAFYPSLLPGRLVSLFCLIAMSGFSWRLLRRHFGAPPWVAAVAAIPWLALIGPLYFGVNNRVDSTSVFLGVAALFVANTRHPKAWIGCAALLLLAGFTRSTAAVAPGVAIFAMYVWNRRVGEALALAGTVIVSAAAILVVGDLVSGGNFSECLVFSNGSVPLRKIYCTTITELVCKQALLPAGGIAALFLLRDPATRMFALHTLLSITLAVVTSGKIGSHVNYFIEPSWSAGLAGGLLLSRLDYPILVRLRVIAACILLFQSAGRADLRVTQFRAEMREFPGLMNLVEKYGAQGPLLTMESGAQVLAGQRVCVADMHIFTRLNEIGKFDLTPIIDDIRQHRYTAILARADIRPNYVGHTNFTPEVRRAVTMHYRFLEQHCGLSAYVPREQPLNEATVDAAGAPITTVRTTPLESGPPHAVLQTAFYPNGRKASEVKLINLSEAGVVLDRKQKKFLLQNPLVQHGIEREWDEQERLLRETTYCLGKISGPETTWYENGRLACRVDYAQWKRHGIAASWHRNGTPWSEARFERGVLQGETALWHESGGAAGETAAARLADAETNPLRR